MLPLHLNALLSCRRVLICRSFPRVTSAVFCRRPCRMLYPSPHPYSLPTMAAHSQLSRTQVRRPLWVPSHACVLCRLEAIAISALPLATHLFRGHDLILGQLGRLSTRVNAAGPWSDWQDDVPRSCGDQLQLRWAVRGTMRYPHHAHWRRHLSGWRQHRAHRRLHCAGRRQRAASGENSHSDGMLTPLHKYHPVCKGHWVVWHGMGSRPVSSKAEILTRIACLDMLK